MKQNQVFECKTGYFSLTGNNKFDTGWYPSRLWDKKKDVIKQALTNANTDKVYRRGNNIYKNLLNGLEIKLN